MTGSTAFVSTDVARIWLSVPDDRPASPRAVRSSLPPRLREEHGEVAIAELLADLARASLIERAGAALELGYDSVADEYDARPPHDDAVFARIRQLTEEQHWADVLEVGCGTGQVLERLASQGARSLHGIDVSRRMLEHARRRLSRAGVRARLQQGRAEVLPFDDDALSMLVIASAHWWLDLPELWSEAQRVLRADNRIVLFTTIPEDRFFELLRPYGACRPDRISSHAESLVHDLPRTIGLLHYEQLQTTMTIESPARLVSMARSLVPRTHATAVSDEVAKFDGARLRWPLRFACVSPFAILEASQPR